jgi:hypothetical protein
VGDGDPSQWDRDLTILPRMATALDPSARARAPQAVRQLGDMLTARAGIDATIAVSRAGTAGRRR